MFVIQVVRIHCVLNIFYGRTKISLNFAAVFIMRSASSVLETFRLLIHASVRVLLTSLLPLPVAKLISSLYFSCNIFSLSLMTSKRFHDVLPLLPETHLA